MTTSDLVRGALAWLATYAVHSTLFLGVAWGLTRLWRPRVNRNQERLWKLALVGGVLSATLQVALGARAPFGHVEWSDPTPTVARAEPGSPAEPRPGRTLRSGPSSSMPPAQPAPAMPVHRAPPRAAPAHEAHGEPTASPATNRDELDSAPSLALPPRPALERGARGARSTGAAPVRSEALERLAGTLRSRWPSWVLAAWTAAGLLGLAGFALSWTTLRRHMLGRELLRDGPLVARLERLRQRAGLAHRVRLSVSARITTPFSTGWLRPEICLPHAVQSGLTPAQQEALLAHELAHLVRRDPTWFALSLLLERLFFFQPLNRLARRNLAELAEIACDDWAVRWTGAHLALASCLTEVAGWVVGERPRLAALPALAGSRSNLGQRVERLLDDRRSPAGEPPTRWWPPIAAATLALAVLAVPGVSSEASRNDREPTRARLDTPRSPAAASLTATKPSPVPVASDSILGTELEPPPAPGGLVADLASQRELESELLLLEAELGALQAEFEARDLDERFTRALTELQARLETLRHQQARAQRLLARLADPEPPTEAPPPPAAGPAPTALTGEPR